MTVAAFKAQNGNQTLRNILRATGMENFAKMKQNCWYQTGVADGGADLDLTSTLKGDLIYDVDNSDYFIVTAAGSSTSALNV